MPMKFTSKDKYISPSLEIKRAAVVMLSCLALAACHTSEKGNSTDPLIAKFENRNVVLAINIGGDAHHSESGVFYQTDQLKLSAPKGTIGEIKGAQEQVVYQSFRQGLTDIGIPLDNGLYDIIFHFAEPNDIATGIRVFNVYAEQNLSIKELDVRSARDGNPRSALDRAIMNVEVKDGSLDIKFEPLKGEAILSGLVVRSKAAPSTEWTMIWNDEFSKDGGIDDTKWSYDIWPAKKVNDENQKYTSDSKNVRVVDGKLILEAHRELDGSADYSSGRIHSKGKGDWLYGRLDIRAKLPAGQGTWPAIWMLPTNPFEYASNCSAGTDWQGNGGCDAWPNSGEIDIMEHVGYDMNRVHGTVHTKAFYWVNGEQRKSSVEGHDVSQAFHVYSLEWGPDRIDVLMDGLRYFTYLKQSDDWQEWPFDHPYHLIMNVAVGGFWGRAGGPIDDSVFPVKMEVDYVRVYKPKN